VSNLQIVIAGDGGYCVPGGAMNLTDIGIVAIDLVFAAAVLAAASGLAYLVYLTIREHAELKSAVRAPAGVVADLGEVRARRALRSLRPSVVHQRVSSSS